MLPLRRMSFTPDQLVGSLGNIEFDAALQSNRSPTSRHRSVVFQNSKSSYPTQAMAFIGCLTRCAIPNSPRPTSPAVPSTATCLGPPRSRPCLRPSFLPSQRVALLASWCCVYKFALRIALPLVHVPGTKTLQETAARVVVINGLYNTEKAMCTALMLEYIRSAKRCSYCRGYLR
jgi:hypothetical protein